ncbi:hypothetical protein mRhiFer1_008678 [Rhinolophus ferrumequinum]|uniref:Uncharacterized protein n=1 Tax=Rhinolophus ferrumequinum TaxID=59479 RepID=A0A7J7U125_RHIFE|nr:hypothetical protein mRhiFer1_008678 [Rhinolophus ferrumequinum]
MDPFLAGPALHQRAQSRPLARLPRASLGRGRVDGGDRGPCFPRGDASPLELRPGARKGEGGAVRGGRGLLAERVPAPRSYGPLGPSAKATPPGPRFPSDRTAPRLLFPAVSQVGMLRLGQPPNASASAITLTKRKQKRRHSATPPLLRDSLSPEQVPRGWRFSRDCSALLEGRSIRKAGCRSRELVG